MTSKGSSGVLDTNLIVNDAVSFTGSTHVGRAVAPTCAKYLKPVVLELDAAFMSRALELARMAEAAGEVPVGAVIVKNGDIVGEGWNRPIGTDDPTAHAEIVALRAAAQNLHSYRLLDTTLYVTLEPCAMCAGAMVHSRVSRLVYGAADPRAGAAGSIFNIVQHSALNHRVESTGGVMAGECGALLRGFFLARR